MKGKGLLPLVLILALLLAGCGQAWADVDRVQDITDAMLAQRMGNYSASGWWERLSGRTDAWSYAAGWDALTGARQALRLDVDGCARLDLSYTPERGQEDTVIAVADPAGQVYRLSPGEQALDLPDGRSWLLIAAVGTGGAFALEMTCTEGKVRVRSA